MIAQYVIMNGNKIERQVREMQDLQSLELEQIMPSSLTEDENTLNVSRSLNSNLQEVSEASNESLLLPRISELPERVVDMMAWQYHVDFYELAQNLEMKRDLVRNSIKWHMKKGTKYAILRALEMLGIKAEYHNWYETGGEPYTFTIDAVVQSEYYEHADQEEIIENIYRAINDSKAARSLFGALNTKININDNADFNVGIGVGLSGNYRVGLGEPESESQIVPKIGIAAGLSGRYKIDAQSPDLELQSSLHIAFYPIELGGNVMVGINEGDRQYIH